MSEVLRMPRPRSSSATICAGMPRRLYALLKRGLAERYSADRDAYTEGKRQFVDEIVRKAESTLGPV